MKQTTLEDLYYGNIHPCEIGFVRGSEYGKCFDKVTELSKSVCSQLPEEYINKMNELESAYRHLNGCNTTNTIQVKMSRTYYSDKTGADYPYYLWFNRFPVPKNADWIVLVGIYAKRPDNIENAKAKSTSWDTIMLAFTNKEMSAFMSEVKQKKDPSKDDKMFGFAFNDEKYIVQTRGCPEVRDMSCYRIENRLEEIRNSFK